MISEDIYPVVIEYDGQAFVRFMSFTQVNQQYLDIDGKLTPFKLLRQLDLKGAVDYLERVKNDKATTIVDLESKFSLQTKKELKVKLDKLNRDEANLELIIKYYSEKLKK